MALTSGSKLGVYEVVALLGAGGMGEVYRARDTRLDRTVAIKVLPPHLSSNSELRQRLEREAKAISSLNHPHICTLHDIGSQDGVDFLVMEYLEGETLAQRILRGALPLEEALRLSIALANALDKAHRQGILHRDLKPSNVMLTKNGPKLMDFGLAKATAEVVAATSGSLTPSTPTLSLAKLSSPTNTLTEKGSIVGTFQYMAPEVLQGAEANGRSDIFSFGCMLYEMVTGRRAFEGKSQFSVLGAILDKEPERIGAVQPSSPPRLDETVRCCLAKNPEERYGCIHDVEIQLKALAGSWPQEIVAPKAATPRAWIAWLVACVAALAALLMAGVYLNLASQSAPVVRSSILPPKGASLLMMAASSGPPVLSPDGTRMTFAARDATGKTLLYVRQLNFLTAQPLAGTDEALYPFWSPNSREIGFFADGKLKKIGASGGPPQTVCDVASHARGGTWSEAGMIVFAGVTGGLSRVSAGGGAPEPASKLDSARGENSHRWPFFLPDGKHFLYWSRNTRGIQDNALYVGTLGSLQGKLLMKSESMAVYASGYLLFMREQTLMARAFSPRRLEVTGEVVPVAEHVAINEAANRPMFSASENGALLYQAGEAVGNWTLSWFGRDGKQTGSVAEPNRYFYPAISPDGQSLAANIFNANQGIGDIWIFDLARGTKTRLTFGPTLQMEAVWAPDGKTVFYESNAKGQFNIYAKAADGSGSERIILESKDASEFPKSFSPDGRYLVYVKRALSGSQTSFDLWVLPMSGDGKPFPIVQTPFDDDKPAVSSDGKWMAYQNNESGRMEVYITAFPGGGAKWQISTNGGSDAKWRRDGKELFFLDPSENLVAVDVNTTGNAPRLGVIHALFQTTGLQRAQGPYDATADGKKFLINSANLKEGNEPVTLVQNWPAELKK